MTTMMSQTAYDFRDTSKVATLSTVESSWRDDIQSHAALTSECDYIASIQQELMDRYLSLKSQLPGKTGLVAANVTSEPPSKTSPTAARAASICAVTLTSQISQIECGLIDLDDRLKKIKTEMYELEGRILTHEPADTTGVKLMLQFVSSVLAMDHKIDPEYLSDVLTCCVEVINT